MPLLGRSLASLTEKVQPKIVSFPLKLLAISMHSFEKQDKSIAVY